MNKNKKAEGKSKNHNPKVKSFKFLLVVLTFSFLLLNLIVSPNLIFAIENKTFDGRIDFLNKDLSFALDLKEQGKLEISGSASDNKYNLKLSLRHIKFARSDILTDFYASGSYEEGFDEKLKSLRGKAWTKNTLLNFKPLKEFSADYQMSSSGLIIHSLKWADFDLKGRIANAERGKFGVKNHILDLSLRINEMDIEELSGLLGVNPKDVSLAGKVSGEVRITGPQNAVKIEAKLMAKKGEVAGIRFNSAKINLEGIWPILRFSDSQINDIDGIVYELKGQFSLRELSDFKCPEHKVVVCVANNAMRFQDWVIKRREDSKGQDYVEAEYSLKKNQALKMRIKNQEETLAWERKVKF